MGTRMTSIFQSSARTVEGFHSAAGRGVQEERIDHGHAAQHNVHVLTVYVRKRQKVDEIDAATPVEVVFFPGRTVGFREQKKVRKVHLSATVEVRVSGFRADDSVSVYPQSRQVLRCA